MSSRVFTQRRIGDVALGVSVAVVLAILYVPVAVLAVFSFNSARSGTRWEGFTTDWYNSIADDRQLVRAVENSLWIALLAMVLSTVLAVMLALGIERTRFRTKRATEGLLHLPIVTPEIVTGVTLLAFFSVILRLLNDILGRSAADALRFGRPTVLLAHIAFDTAFVLLVVRSGLRGLDPTMTDASADLGATPWQTFRRVTLPAIAPVTAGGALLAFTLSLDNVVISFFVTGPGATTLPVEIYSRLRRSISPQVNAVATLMFVASMLVAFAALGLHALASRHRSRSEPRPDHLRTKEVAA